MTTGTGWPPPTPAHWERVPLKHVVEITGGSTPSKEEPAFWGGDIPWVTPKDMKVPRIENTVDSVTDKAIARTGLRRIAEPGVMMVVRGMILARRLPLAVNVVPVTINQDMKHLRPKRGSVDYLAYVLAAASDDILSNLDEAGHGTKALRSEQVFSTFIPFPPISEQKAIAAYLDRETARIDGLVERLERLIALLTEKRQAVISHVVARGLDLSAPTKPSGIDWLGEIPAHWEVKRLKHLVGLRSGDAITSDEIEDEGPFAVFGGNGLRGYAKRYNLTGEFILIGRQGALCGNVNYASGTFLASEHALVCHPRAQFDRIWLGETLRSMNLGQHSASAAQPGLSAETLMALEIPIPPLIEQRRIAAFVSSSEQPLDEIRGMAGNSINLLRERRAALISAAVTGQIPLAEMTPHAEAAE